MQAANVAGANRDCNWLPALPSNTVSLQHISETRVIRAADDDDGARYMLLTIVPFSG